MLSTLLWKYYILQFESDESDSGVTFSVSSDSGKQYMHLCMLCALTLSSFLTGTLFSNTTKASYANSSDNTAVSISLPPSVFQELNTSEIGLVFTMYNSSVMFPSANTTAGPFRVASTVVGATVAGYTFHNLSDNVTIVLRLHESVSWQNILLIQCFHYCFLLCSCTKYQLANTGTQMLQVRTYIFSE